MLNWFFNIFVAEVKFYSSILLGTADINQERIVEEGGLDALLSLLETSENTTIHRVTAGAIANLAMNGNGFQRSTVQISLNIWSKLANNHLLAHCHNFLMIIMYIGNWLSRFVY